MEARVEHAFDISFEDGIASPLSEEERPAELARIMGSVNDPLAIQHARNLLRSAKES